eukprot:CAMPEP_0175532938 /NCGR_PEP_ID=MMETSP0096-20121207/22924_1 /TAXON_ID=311494 /ORGANISM="Alexandrium monilatum, Strain CCMP3105" /LENGTH=74 /DNA_ID=CAMNT_0016835685 /DNA_START=228 /DNA_END=448 /DNA_ORIENTATION=+
MLSHLKNFQPPSAMLTIGPFSPSTITSSSSPSHGTLIVFMPVQTQPLPTGMSSGLCAMAPGGGAPGQVRRDGLS